MARVLLDRPQSLTEPPDNFKPLDFGANGINGSLDWNGRIIALNWYHPQHGYVTLTSADPFPEDQRYNPAAVRAYRTGLAKLAGFGFDFQSPIDKFWIAFSLEESGMAVMDFAPGGYCFLHNRLSAVSYFTGVRDNIVQQHLTFEGRPPIWHGRLSLQRCAYTQLTEGGPVPATPSLNKILYRDGILTIRNPALDCEVIIEGLPHSDSCEIEQEGPVEIELTGELPLEEDVDNLKNARLTFRLNPSIPFARHNKMFERIEFRDVLISNDLLVRRGQLYGLNMAVSVQEGICLITDHILLPLSWNRDAYYVARALLSWTKEMHDIVRRHLIWMFEIAERPGGVWGRCYLANGRQKDPAFQLDQQLWPLLEFAEYVQETGDHATFERLQSQVSTILDTLLTHRNNPDVWLFSTDETPADDPIALPYHLSSHVLFWRTLKKLAEVFPAQSSEQDKYLAWAEHIRAAIQQYFIAEHRKFGPIYAYATEGEGHFHFYHDANDFPLVLAPIWGFCGADDPIWRATIAFAWSPENEGGYYEGRLGSVHTRAAWPLGDVQELIVTKIVGDVYREKKVRQNLKASAQWDGALPEAVDPQTNAVVSRHWFAWPNAALACVELGAFRVQ